LCVDQGSISPNFVGHPKRHWRTEFGKKIAVQFHQQNLSQICALKFAKGRYPFAEFVHQKKLLILCAQKSRMHVLVKSATRVNFSNISHAAFSHNDPKSAKQLYFFELVGSALIKAEHKM